MQEDERLLSTSQFRIIISMLFRKENKRERTKRQA